MHRHTPRRWLSAFTAMRARDGGDTTICYDGVPTCLRVPVGLLDQLADAGAIRWIGRGRILDTFDLTRDVEPEN